MIKTKEWNGLITHYSDKGLLIRQIETGNLYSSATDVLPCKFSYEETEQLGDNDGEDVSAEEIQAALEAVL